MFSFLTLSSVKILSQNLCGKYSTLTLMVGSHLILNADSSFTYEYYSCTARYISSGNWSTKGKNIILKSHSEEKIKEDTTYDKWNRIHIFNDVVMTVKNGKAALYEEPTGSPTILYHQDSRKAKKWERNRNNRRL